MCINWRGRFCRRHVKSCISIVMKEGRSLCILTADIQFHKAFKFKTEGGKKEKTGHFDGNKRASTALLTEAERSSVGERYQRKLCLVAKWWVHVQGNSLSMQWWGFPLNHNGKYTCLLHTSTTATATTTKWLRLFLPGSYKPGHFMWDL